MEMQLWLVTTCVCLCASTDRAQELPSRLGTREGFIASHGNSFPSAISGLRFPTHSQITRLCRFFFFGNLCHEGAKLFELRYTIFVEMSGEKALWLITRRGYLEMLNEIVVCFFPFALWFLSAGFKQTPTLTLISRSS